MRIELLSFEGDLNRLGDLEELIPEGCTGEALNYGQGEGQFRIDEAVWGIYVGNNGNYFLQYEEGCVSPDRFLELWRRLVDHLSIQFSSVIQISGIFDGRSDV